MWRLSAITADEHGGQRASRPPRCELTTRLDQILMTVVEQTPEWRSALSAESVMLVEKRLGGATLEEIAKEFGLTRAGVRFRLYGTGHGAIRRGGVLGSLRRVHQGGMKASRSVQ